MKQRKYDFTPHEGVRKAGLILFILLGAMVMAGGTNASPIHVATIKTEIESMYLTGDPAYMPLGQGYSPVQSLIQIQESPTMSSHGMSQISRVNGSATDFQVTSFFDIFLDITITDVDSANNFFGRQDGADIFLSTKAKLQGGYVTSLDPNQPLLNLFPPPEQTTLSGKLSPSKIPLEADLNGDGKMDSIKFDIFSISMGSNPTFTTLPDGTVILNFDLGAVVTGNVNPPFTIGSGSLSGPTTASSELLGGPAVPLPGTLFLLGSGLLGLTASNIRKKS